MKKLMAIIMTAMLASVLVITGCQDPFADELGGGAGHGESKPEKHQWKANELTVTPAADKYEMFYKQLLVGEYSKSDFKIMAKDTYYCSETDAENSGYKYEQDVSADTKLTVNDKEYKDGEKFTVEFGKNYKVTFTYGDINPVSFDFFGNVEGGIIPSTGTIKIIEGVSLKDVSLIGYDFKVLEMSRGAFTGDSLISNTVRLERVDTGSYSIFVGSDEKNLVKLEKKGAEEATIADCSLNVTDKVIKIYHEQINSVADATTLPYTLELSISPISKIANASVHFGTVAQEGVELSLLSLFKNRKEITVYDDGVNKESVGLRNAEIGKIKMIDVDGETYKVRPYITLEIYDNFDCTGTPVAVINKDTTEADKWTPGAGVEETTYSFINLEIVPSGTKNVYYVKIIYDDGKGTFTSKNVKSTDEDGTTFVYLSSDITVSKPTVSE